MIHRRYHTSELSLQTATGKWSVQLSQFDTGTFTFDHEAAYTSVAASLFRADTGLVETINGATGPQMEIDPVGETAIVTLSGLARTAVYELIVTFTDADDHTDTYTLAIECVA